MINIDSKKLPQNTRLNSNDAQVKRVRVNEFIGELLSEIASELNKKFTQGVIAYEYLLMDRNDITDPIDDMEQVVDSELSNFDIKPENINRISYEKRLDQRDQFDSQKRRNIWIPKDINTDWDTFNDKIQEAIINGYNSIYTDRFERIQVKKDILKLIKSNGEKSVESNKAENIYLSNFDEYNVPDELKLNYDIDIETKSDYYKIAGSMSRWKNRFEVLDNLLQNRKYTLDEVVKFIQDCHNLDSKSYTKRKIREFSRLYGHTYIIDSDSLVKKDISNVTVDNYDEIYEKHNYTMQEILHSLAKQNGGKITKSSIRDSWCLDEKLITFVKNCNGIVYAHKGKSIVTKEKYDKLKRK